MDTSRIGCKPDISPSSIFGRKKLGKYQILMPTIIKKFVFVITVEQLVKIVLNGSNGSLYAIVPVTPLEKMTPPLKKNPGRVHAPTTAQSKSTLPRKPQILQRIS
jgi:hypothetical protein